MTYKGVKLRIYPNKEQQQKIKLNFGYNRFVWNQMLSMLIERHKNNPDLPFPSAFTLDLLIPALKREHTWLKQSESTSLLRTVKDLTEAYKKFFRGLNDFPKFKSKKIPKQSYTSSVVGKNTEQVANNYIKLPKLGIMKFSGNNMVGKPKSVTVRVTPAGKYYAVILCEAEIEKLEKNGQSVGLDMGVADLLITSHAKKYPTIRFDKKWSKEKHYWEKRLARRRLQAKKEIAWDHHNKVLNPRELSDFKNYLKAKQMVAKYNEKIANQRNNYLHALTKTLVEQYDVIKIEDLKAKNLMRNHKLARAIANQSWRELRSQLEYKCAWYGKQLVTVNPRKTSQICSNCGYDDGKHTLDIRQWTCPHCGTNHDRDINAAINILNA